LTLSVRGGLEAEVFEGGLGARRFVDEAGEVPLTYSGLGVLDADGRALPARLDAGSRELSIEFDDRGARYPLTVDPVAQATYVNAVNTGADDQFGTSVAVSGNTVAVGAPSEDSNATGVNGDPFNNASGASGAVYVFVRNGSTWSQQAYVKASNPGTQDFFGYPVALSGNTVAIGAYGESSAATGVNGNGADDSAHQSGAA
jgi:hypothetical protein